MADGKVDQKTTAADLTADPRADGMKIEFVKQAPLMGDQVFVVRLDGMAFLSVWKAEDGTQWYSTGIDPEDRQVSDLIERYPHLARDSWDCDFGTQKREAERNIRAMLAEDAKEERNG